MRGGSLLGSIVASFAFPGFGQGLSVRRVRMLAWAVASVAATLAMLWSVWFLPVTLVVRAAAAIDAYFVLSKHTPPRNYMLAAIAVVIGVLGYGGGKLAIVELKIPSSSMMPTLVIGDHIYVDKLTPRFRAIERGELVVFTQPCARAPYVKRVIAIGGDTVEVRCSVVYVNGAAIPSALVRATDSYRDRDDFEGTWYSRTASRYRERHGGRSYDVFHDPDRPQRDASRTQGDVRDFPDLDLRMMPSCRGASVPPADAFVATKPNASACEPQLHFVVPANALFMMSDNRNNANDSRIWGTVSRDAVIGRVIGIWLTDGAQFSRFGAVD